jgi:hypothetical protein
MNYIITFAIDYTFLFSLCFDLEQICCMIITSKFPLCFILVLFQMLLITLTVTVTVTLTKFIKVNLDFSNSLYEFQLLNLLIITSWWSLAGTTLLYEAKWVCFLFSRYFCSVRFETPATSNSYVINKMKIKTLVLKMKVVKYKSVFNWK